MKRYKRQSHPKIRTKLFSKFAKKALLTSLGAIFMTEESIRNILGEMKLPKEAMGFVVDQAKKQKDDLVSVVAAEVSKFFSKINVHEEIQKALSHLHVHVDAKLSFSPKGRPLTKKVEVDFEEG